MGRLLLDSEINPLAVVIVVGVIALIFVYVYGKDHFDKKKGFDSAEKKEVEAIIQRLAPEGELLTAAYADWEETTYGMGRSTTKYWYYAIGFNDNVLCVVPLSFQTGDMSYKDYWYIHKEDIGIFNSSVKANWVELYDKAQQPLLKLTVSESNTKLDSYNPVNIQQAEAVAAFRVWRDRWMAEVNAVNGVTASGKLGKPVSKKK